MGIAPGLFYSAARLIGDILVEDEEANPLGSYRGVIGTSFCVQVKSEAGNQYGYLVTADHVLEQQDNVEVQFADAQNEGELHPPNRAMDWRRPLDDVDLAVCPMQSVQIDRPRAMWATAPLEEFTREPGPGDRVDYIGFLDPLQRPMLRSGTLGAADQHGIEHDDGYVYPAHLVDCRSYEGFSGSPCFLVLQFGSNQASGLPTDIFPPPDDAELSEIFELYIPCGMFTEHLDDENPDGAASRYGVGVMLRGREIKKALMSDGLAKERTDWDRGIERPDEDKPGPRAARKRRTRSSGAVRGVRER